MRTYQPKHKDIKREWHLIDAEGQILGRMATQVANFLMGKHKTGYSRHLDMGDYVVVINADKVQISGRKRKQKVYRRHSGFPGGFKEVSFEKMITEKPSRVVEMAVSGMLPGNRLKQKRMRRLKVVAGPKNPYQDKFKEKSK